MIGRATRNSAPVKTPPRKRIPATGPGMPRAYAITITQAPRTVKRTTCTGESLSSEGVAGGAEEVRYAGHGSIGIRGVRDRAHQPRADDHPVGEFPDGRRLLWR
jgi:hypothetical protein